MSARDAASAARDEAELWAELIEVEPEGWDDVPPTELATVGFFDPADDLAKRAAQWSHTLPDHRLGSLAAFAAGLAVAEAKAWDAEEQHVATKAYEDRRFLAGDRIAHWAVPWLDAVAAEYDESGAVDSREVLLELGDQLRLAPALTGSEGVVPEGNDAFSPLSPPGPLGTVRTGAVLLRPFREGIAHLDAAVAADPYVAARLAGLHDDAASRWRGLAWLHPGTAQLWNDLTTRAETTAKRLGLLHG